MPGRTRRLAAFTAVSALALLAGCGGSDGGGGATTTSRPKGDELTSADAERLAQMLFRNQQAGGADVSVRGAYSEDATVLVEGKVDWEDHTGALTATSTFADGRPDEVRDVIFTEDALYVAAGPEEQALLAQQGHPGIRWIRRTPDLTRPLDQVVDLLASLAATKPDNPQLVEQGDLRYAGGERIDGAATTAYEGPKGTYWLADDSGRLVRVSGKLAGFAGPVQVDLAPPGPTQVTVPADATVADESLLQQR